MNEEPLTRVNETAESQVGYANKIDEPFWVLRIKRKVGQKRRGSEKRPPFSPESILSGNDTYRKVLRLSVGRDDKSNMAPWARTWALNSHCCVQILASPTEWTLGKLTYLCASMLPSVKWNNDDDSSSIHLEICWKE